jgi:cytoskeletal protein CcmA (bactofilin family)
MDNEQNEAKESLDSSLEYNSGQAPSAPNPISPQPTTDTTHPEDTPPATTPKQPAKQLFSHVSRRSTIFLPLFGLLVIAVIVITVLAYQHGKSTTPPVADQNLTPAELSHLANSNEVVGTSNQVLSVQSSSIFNGQVLIRKNLQVAGTIKVGGSLNLPGISVSGNSTFSQLQVANNLSVGGNTNIQGNLTVQKDLSVNGSGTFSGPLNAPQITVATLQLTGDLNLTNHINAGGPIPSRNTGSAVGSGGTSSVSGSDTAGTATINTGSNPAAGCYITVNFVNAFSNTPDVVITPVGSASASLSYYVNRSTTSFSICAINAPQAGQTYIFDYIALD